ncbi:twin-arginine translocase subunit TatC [Alteromonas sp. 5E99-2]|uniref:twin-arginine translocase subunit TatC n=1 Tax=Alteromonas sp. 5E99-2 TaxID=2817683 RepID=UPI001A983D01|nr:twin-arginine translocase subunit TatC [Alteromonas sp. 5E99-2]MBO1254598.1 twin-arginine translocase subunit TatC [Alteromonas sp. 5E99-2]
MSDSQSLISHLIDLRNSMLKGIGCILVIFCGLAFFAQDLYQWLAEPLLASLPENATMIATDVASPFFAPFKLTLVVSFFVAIPYVLYQVWSFVAPGLYKNEKRLIAPLMFSSTLLFYAGVAFAYFVVFPLAFTFFANVAPEGVVMNTDINSYLSFVLKIFFAFGLSFEIPVAIILLCWTGVTSAESLRTKRPYVIVGAFIMGMLLTPPDVISQILLAIPMWILFEVGIVIGSMYASRNQSSDNSEQKIG